VRGARNRDVERYAPRVASRLLSKLRAYRDHPSAPLAGFLVRFLVYLWIAAQAIGSISSEQTKQLQSATAGVVATVFGLFSDRIHLAGDVVTYDGFAVRIVSECFGLFEMAIFGAAVLAFDASWRKRGLGLALGLPAIYGLNLLRIAMLLVVGRHIPGLFEFAHIYFWQATLILVITLLWLLWVRFVVRDASDRVVRA